jgi:hypothetical protein
MRDVINGKSGSDGSGGVMEMSPSEKGEARKMRAILDVNMMQD